MPVLAMEAVISYSRRWLECLGDGFFLAAMIVDPVQGPTGRWTSGTPSLDGPLFWGRWRRSSVFCVFRSERLRTSFSSSALTVRVDVRGRGFIDKALYEAEEPAGGLAKRGALFLA